MQRTPIRLGLFVLLCLATITTWLGSGFAWLGVIPSVQAEASMLTATVPSTRLYLPMTSSAPPVSGRSSVTGSILLNEGRQFVAVTAGTVVEIRADLAATSTAGRVREMRIHTLAARGCASADEMAAVSWEPFASRKTFSHNAPINWSTFSATVQYRDAQGNTSPLYCDELAVEGMPETPLTGTPARTPAVTRTVTPTGTPTPTTTAPTGTAGSIELEEGRCCVGGIAGQPVEIHASLRAGGTPGRVREMRLLTFAAPGCAPAEHMMWVSWEPFATNKTFSHTAPHNWSTFTATVQYRDEQGNTSPLYCDEIAVEGMPGTTTATPSITPSPSPTPATGTGGSVLLEDGLCCVGGIAGQPVEIHAALVPGGTPGRVREMRIRVSTFFECASPEQMEAVSWEPFATSKTFSHTPPSGWSTFSITVQYRDEQGNLSPLYWDEVAVEGMPGTTTVTPTPTATGTPASTITFGSIQLEEGRCCVGGIAGQPIEIHAGLMASSTAGRVHEMRLLTLTAPTCASAEQMAAVSWEPFATSKTFSHTPPPGWSSFSATVQYRDDKGNTSPLYCDEVAVEGMPEMSLTVTPTVTPTGTPTRPATGPTRTPTPSPTPSTGMAGSIELEEGLCCVGGTAGQPVEIQASLVPGGTPGRVHEMRIRVSTLLECASPEDMEAVSWEPVATSKTFSHTPPNGWSTFSVTVQYRDEQGNLSPLYWDEVAVEGMPPNWP